MSTMFSAVLNRCNFAQLQVCTACGIELVLDCEGKRSAVIEQ